MESVDLDIRLAGKAPDYTAQAETEALGSTNPMPLALAGNPQLLGSVALADVFDPAVDLPAGASPFVRALQELQSGYPSKGALDIVGSGLYNALDRTISDFLNRVWGRVQGDSTKLLRIRLHFAAPELAMLPWEYLKIGDTFLCENPSLSLIRFPEVGDPVPKLGVAGQLKILIWAANPKSTAALDFGREITTIETELKAAQPDAQIDTVRTGGPADLVKKLRGGYHVLHYIGHGRFEGEGKLAFAPADGADPIWVTADQIKPGLLGNPTLQLVFLNSCETATGAATSAYASLGFNLARYTPAVIAMQYPITNSSAVCFAQGFYEAAGGQDLLDRCITRARQNLIGTLGEAKMDWGIPALFTRAEAGPLLLPPLPTATLTAGYIAGPCAPALPDFLDSVTVSDDDQAYLTAVRQTYSEFANSAFTPLRFLPPQLIGRRVLAQGGSTVELRSLCDTTKTLANASRLLVLGRPGIGKTSLLAYLAQAYYEVGKGKVLPVVASLRAWKDPPDHPRTLLQFLKDFLVDPVGDAYPLGDSLAAHLEEYLPDSKQQRRLLFLLDDYNRMPHDDAADYARRLAEIKTFSRKYNQAMMVVISRSRDYDGGLDGCRPAFQVAEINTWSRDQIVEYLLRNAPDLQNYANDPAFLGLADIPYQLAQIVDLVRKEGVPVQTLRSTQTLMQAFLDRLFTYSEQCGTGNAALRGRVQTALSTLATALSQHNQQGTYVSYADAVSYLGAQGAGADTSTLFGMAADATILDMVANKQQVGFERQQLEDYFREVVSTPGDDYIQAALLMDYKGQLDVTATTANPA